MTRRDYELIAKAFSEAKRSLIEPEEYPYDGISIYAPYKIDDWKASHAINRIEYFLVQMLKSDNPRFDPEKFRKACSLEQ